MQSADAKPELRGAANARFTFQLGVSARTARAEFTDISCQIPNRYEKDKQSQVVHFSFELAHPLSYE